MKRIKNKIISNKKKDALRLKALDDNFEWGF